MMLFLFALLIGGAFGLLFRIWILLPASLMIMAGIGLFGDGAFIALLQRCALALLCLQGGYGMGLTARHLIVAGRARALLPAEDKTRRQRVSRPV